MNVPQLANTGIDTQGGARIRTDGQRTLPAAASKASGGSQRIANTEPVQASAETSPVQKPTSEQLKAAVNEINRALQQSNRALEFSVDEDTDRLIVRLKDGETGETIRQFPSDETLAIARYIADVQQGLLISQKV